MLFPKVSCWFYTQYTFAFLDRCSQSATNVSDKRLTLRDMIRN